MRNTLVIYRLSDNRVLQFGEQSYGMPKITDFDSMMGDSTDSYFDSETMGYQVGVNSYDEDDFDADTGLLTSTACTKYGVDIGEVANYIKDLEIDLPVTAEGQSRVDDFVVEFDEDDKISAITDDALSVEYRPTHLALTFNAIVGGGIADQGQDAYNGLPTWDAVTDLDTDRLEITVRKLYEDDTPAEAVGDDDEVVLRVSGGKIFGDYHKNLVEGVCTFEWQPPMGSVIATATVVHGNDVYAPGQELLPGTESIQLLNYPEIEE